MKMYSRRTARPAEPRVASLGERRRPAITGRCARYSASVLLAACLTCTALPGPAAAIQTLEAADHAELEAAVSATGVSRVALADDRIRRVIRSPGGFDIEHDATAGDLYLRPVEAPSTALDGMAGAPLPITLFLGTERGFTYRLSLIPDARPSAQVLVRNAAAAHEANTLASPAAMRDTRVAELARLVRAAVRREVLSGYAVATGRSGPGHRAIETWRGAQFTAHVMAVDSAADTGALAERFGTGVAAVWVAPPQPGAPQARIAVVVTEPGRAGAGR